VPPKDQRAKRGGEIYFLNIQLKKLEK
jgi:hypothetical protein